MSIRLRFACGHETTVAINADAAPRCGCGETRITRTFSRPPSFRGSCTGPYAQSQAMEPGVVDVAPGGALTLKQE